MKKFISIVLAVTLSMYSCLAGYAQENENKYRELSDPNLRTYLEDTLYDELLTELDSEEYYVENVQAIYISQEYLDELAYNSAANVFFGYSLDELDEQFQGEKYIFTLGEDGQTAVKPWEPYDDLYEKVIKNVAVGTGVILVCVTVSVVTAGVGAPAVSMVFAVAASSGATGAISGAALGGVSAGIVTGIQTGDMEQALRAAALSGSEGFKWGAITGAISGGVGEAVALKGATLNGLTMDEAALIQKESKYPLDVIKEFQSMEQYEVCKEAGIYPKLLDGKTALIREIDLNQVDEMGRSNLQRIAEDLAPLDPTGKPYELHHVGQKVDSTLAILTDAEHRLGDSYKIWHNPLKPGEGVHAKISAAQWNATKIKFWKDYVASVAGVIL